MAATASTCGRWARAAWFRATSRPIRAVRRGGRASLSPLLLLLLLLRPENTSSAVRQKMPRLQQIVPGRVRARVRVQAVTAKLRHRQRAAQHKNDAPRRTKRGGAGAVAVEGQTIAVRLFALPRVRVFGGFFLVIDDGSAAREVKK